jgi:hypothetical protein
MALKSPYVKGLFPRGCFWKVVVPLRGRTLYNAFRSLVAWSQKILWAMLSLCLWLSLSISAPTHFLFFIWCDLYDSIWNFAMKFYHPPPELSQCNADAICLNFQNCVVKKLFSLLQASCLSYFGVGIRSWPIQKIGTEELIPKNGNLIVIIPENGTESLKLINTNRFGEFG